MTLKFCLWVRGGKCLALRGGFKRFQGQGAKVIRGVVFVINE